MSARVTLVCGLGYGDEGKGTTVDFLARARRTSLVVRYNGGAQAAHNVVDETACGERHHTFAQFGSGTFAGVPTLLSRHVLVDPISLFAEARHLAAVGVRDPLALLAVEEGAIVTTPFHVAMNRLREMARSGRHGSCGMGIGETRADAIAQPKLALRIRDLRDPKLTRDKLALARDRMLAFARALPAGGASDAAGGNEAAGASGGRGATTGWARQMAMLEDEGAIAACLARYDAFARSVAIVPASYLAGALAMRGDVIFEGAQGVLLDEKFGFQPYTTWTDITFANAIDLLGDFQGIVTRLGLLRAYATRHGAGPFVTEDARFAPLSAHDHNRAGPWQGAFRSGTLDLVAARYALDVVGGVDGLVIGNLDRLALLPGARVPVCTRYANAEDRAFFDSPARIRVARPPGRAHQAALACALERVKPVDAGISRAGYAEEIAAALGVRLFLTSFGPTARDKSLKIPAQAPFEEAEDRWPPPRAQRAVRQTTESA